MMMIKRAILFIGCLLIVSAISSAQDKDFGIWYSISAEKDLIKNIELDAELNLRTYKNAGNLEEAFIDLGITYKFNKFLSAAAGYRFTEFMENDDSFHPRHQWFTDLKGKVGFGDFDISARLRYQQRYKTYIEDENDKESKKVGRFKFLASYDIPSFPLNPFISAELFLPLFFESSTTIEKTRLAAGLEYNFLKKQSIKAEYLFQRDNYPKQLDMNIISIGYKLKL